MPRHYFGNPLCLNDIFLNLASYPLFCLDKDCVFFDIRAIPLGGNRHRIFTTVTTTGETIPLHKLGSIFQPASKTGGQGSCSLFIAKTLASLFGGDLSLENSSDWGTRFILHLVMDSGTSSPVLKSQNSICLNEFGINNFKRENAALRESAEI
jgi:hypothetical protein